MSKVIKRRNAVASKNLILRNATKLFSKKGYSPTSMEELASMCDLNKAMIFYYFDSKQGLYEAVIVEVLDEIYSHLAKKNKNIDDPKQELSNFITTFASFSDTHSYLPSLLLKELSDSGAKIPKTLFSHMRKLYMLFVDILKRGEEAGDFFDVVPMIIYFMIMGTLNLMVTTKSLRNMAHEMDGLDTCSTCDMDEISEYIDKKVQKLLKDKS